MSSILLTRRDANGLSYQTLRNLKSLTSACGLMCDFIVLAQNIYTRVANCTQQYKLIRPF